LVRLPEHFADAERILLWLTLAETEAYVNNASGVWRQLFRPWLSGTVIPFRARLHLLEQRFQTRDGEQLALCLGALRGPLTVEGRLIERALGPPLIAGRLPPAEWRPASTREARECWTGTVELLKQLARSECAALREGVLDLVVKHVSAFLRCGSLPNVIDLLGAGPLPDQRLVELLRTLDRFGTLAAELLREAEVARAFLDHPLQRVRDWAQYETDRAAHEAAAWHTREEELAAP
jgi:hypothetical protein